MMRGFCPRRFCPERAYVLMELCMEGVLSKGVLSEGVLSGGGFVLPSLFSCPPAGRDNHFSFVSFTRRSHTFTA